jgi:O-antigen/teichoic acid export membrane protein
MFVVTPFLAANQSYFGIYTFVISLNLFLSYADFGFLNAGVKFASEAYAKNNRKEEIDILGFVFFILGFVFFIFGLLITFFYFYPHSILNGLNTPDTVQLIKELFLVFIICLPILAANRLLQLIFNIRLHDYKYQRIYSLLNLLKIASVFLFFMNGEYHIVGYYILTQLFTLTAIILGCRLAIKDYNYDFIALLKALKFNSIVYAKTKDLAFNSLFVTISWVLYYELDSLIIGKFVGLKEVAIFNICISVMSLSRSLYSILYNPFTAKFNHYIGRNEKTELKSTFYKVLVFGLPLSLIPTTIIVLTMKSFIYSWVE